jgi:hypothetical protein
MDEKLNNKIKEYENRLKYIEDILFGLKDDRVFRAKIQNAVEQGSGVGSRFLSIPGPEDVTISSGVITITQGFHTVETEGAAASDDLDTINDNGIIPDFSILVLRATSVSRTVVVKDGTGNLRLAGDCTLDHSDDTITLLGNGTVWYELARSNNNT